MIRRYLPSVLLAAFALAFLAWAVLSLVNDDDREPTSTAGLVSAEELSEFAADRSSRVYWLGEMQNAEYQMEETESGGVRIRYLDKDSDVVAAVATYPTVNGVAEIKRAVRETDGAELGRSSDGAYLLIDPATASNVHLAYPGDEVSIEVFTPEPGEALLKAANGAVEPVP